MMHPWEIFIPDFSVFFPKFAFLSFHPFFLLNQESLSTLLVLLPPSARFRRNTQKTQEATEALGRETA